MTLTPQAEAHLAAAAGAGARPVHELTVGEARMASLGYLDLQRPAPGVHSVTDTFIPGPTADLPIRIYRTTTAPDLPAVLMLHGSGWVIGTIDLADEPARQLALDTGYVVITVNYQKAPEHPFPQPLDDCAAAFTWMRDHAADLGIDRDRIAVVGDSAGGNLAAALCLRLRDQGVDGPAAQALLYPALAPDFTTASHRKYDEGTGLSSADMRWFWSHYLHGQLNDPDPHAAPLTARSLTGLPPAYIAAVEHDVLHDDATAYARRLADAGTSVELEEYPGMIHGFYWMDAVLDDSRQLQRRLAAWLTRTLAAAL
ncbi:alpha/beta hydrolase [Ruania halotolerans]|uniref:alpha/beta hydrolase n=1 Tax=Ruania halotolerans TaxID=2897773 RepID=UPI001E37F963|nr:alpha/beta hydrolase [Ruania halotolerans]UFU05945.1 alpha/beta hydrolase [Ruania halotolerans]